MKVQPNQQLEKRPTCLASTGPAPAQPEHAPASSALTPARSCRTTSRASRRTHRRPKSLGAARAHGGARIGCSCGDGDQCGGQAVDATDRDALSAPASARTVLLFGPLTYRYSSCLSSRHVCLHCVFAHLCDRASECVLVGSPRRAQQLLVLVPGQAADLQKTSVSGPSNISDAFGPPLPSCPPSGAFPPAFFPRVLFLLHGTCSDTLTHSLVLPLGLRSANESKERRSRYRARERWAPAR